MSTVSRASGAVPWRLLIAATAVVALGAAVISIRDTLLVVFLGVFGALVFEVPLRAFMRWTKRGRGLSATIVVLGTAVAVTVLLLVLLYVGIIAMKLGRMRRDIAALRDARDESEAPASKAEAA